MFKFRSFASDRIAIAMLVLGIAVGSGATIALRPGATSAAEPAMGGMSMPPKSPGDTEMNAAMAAMTRAMAGSALTGDQDRDFMSMMIPHHRSAVDMARIELRRGHHAQLKALARDIIESQGAETLRMRGWLAAWYGRS